MMKSAALYLLILFPQNGGIVVTPFGMPLEICQKEGERISKFSAMHNQGKVKFSCIYSENVKSFTQFMK